MKLSKRDVNLILGVLSLLLIVAFIFLIYTPKYQQYQAELDKIQPYQDKLKEGQAVLKSLPDLEKTLQSYQDQRQVATVKKEFKETDFFATIEELADQSNIDLSSFVSASTAGATTTPPATTPNGAAPVDGATPTATPNTDPNKPAEQTSPANGATATNGTTPANGTTPTAQPTPTTGGYAYNVSIKGEYRSIMVFIFELRNLEFPATIKGFKLHYNSGESKTNGFPLEATFTIAFENLGGAN